MKTALGGLLILIGSLTAATGMAASQTNLEPALLPPGAEAASAILRVVGALVFVLALFLAGVWLVRHRPFPAGRGSRLGKFQILECRALGARHCLYVAGYEKQRFLLASSPAGVTLLAQLPDAGELANQETVPPVAFRDVIQRLLGRPS